MKKDILFVDTNVQIEYTEFIQRPSDGTYFIRAFKSHFCVKWSELNILRKVRRSIFFSSVKMETICEQSSANDFFNLKLGTLPFQEELAAQNRHSAKKNSTNHSHQKLNPKEMYEYDTRA